MQELLAPVLYTERVRKIAKDTRLTLPSFESDIKETARIIKGE
jgi:hypothetical protein